MFRVLGMYNFDLGTYAFTAKLAAFPTRIHKESAFCPQEKLISVSRQDSIRIPIRKKQITLQMDFLLQPKQNSNIRPNQRRWPLLFCFVRSE